jgi:uncharacterized protein YcfL
MKHVILCLLPAFALVGCASTSSTRTEIDQDKIAAIERLAQRNGVQVIWVNQPMRVVR